MRHLEAIAIVLVLVLFLSYSHILVITHTGSSTIYVIEASRALAYYKLLFDEPTPETLKTFFVDNPNVVFVAINGTVVIRNVNSSYITVHSIHFLRNGSILVITVGVRY